MKIPEKSRDSQVPPEAIAFSQTAAKFSLLPGLLLTGLMAGSSIGLSQILGVEALNPLLLAVLLGISWQQLIPIRANYRPGIQFAMKRILRLAVILLGLRLSLDDVLAVGPAGLGIVVISSVSTFYLTCWLGRYLYINPRLTLLIAAGTSICGASAVVATNAVVESSEEDVTYAMAIVTALGTLAMLFYPFLARLLTLNPSDYGIWCGVSIHEVAQVVATAFQRGATSGDLATITKLSRVLLLIPLVMLLGWQAKDSHTQHPTTGMKLIKIPVPWFVLLFALVVVVNSILMVPPSLKILLLSLNQWLLCIAMAAMGLETSLQKLSKTGVRPFYLAVASWIFLAGVSLALIKLQARL
ncbi:YeiH family protein [Leptothoe sp. PORK10 BA2]|uniref:YeiH family protein n=1 Tax=Leptothoe sp. PORK10 BA2 TaxID=3110254 RepID=UPI002B200EC0|nr:putative sulfate exporter family transporter [Leptothoe sp. PORK10 BA2]MEA5466795.1 putative sulfate exporter family transporter [Leptothoe sp. PORK10 BA2]